MEELPARELACVTHSLGGILVRHMGERVPFTRVIMLAPPNQGSRMARVAAAVPPLRWFYGPALAQLRDPKDWPALSVPFAVIAGTQKLGLNPTGWLTAPARIFEPGEPHDGTVAVSETHLRGMVDFATVAASHSFIMDHPQVRAMILRFLAEGRLR